MWGIQWGKFSTNLYSTGYKYVEKIMKKLDNLSGFMTII